MFGDEVADKNIKLAGVLGHQDNGVAVVTQLSQFLDIGRHTASRCPNGIGVMRFIHD